MSNKAVNLNLKITHSIQIRSRSSISRFIGDVLINMCVAPTGLIKPDTSGNANKTLFSKYQVCKYTYYRMLYFSC